MATWATIASAVGASVLGHAVQSVQATTDSVPTAVDEGFSLATLRGFAMTIECDVGQTFSAAGVQDN